MAYTSFTASAYTSNMAASRPTVAMQFAYDGAAQDVGSQRSLVTPSWQQQQQPPPQSSVPQSYQQHTAGQRSQPVGFGTQWGAAAQQQAPQPSGPAANSSSWQLPQAPTNQSNHPHPHADRQAAPLIYDLPASDLMPSRFRAPLSAVYPTFHKPQYPEPISASAYAQVATPLFRQSQVPDESDYNNYTALSTPASPRGGSNDSFLYQRSRLNAIRS
eukprot:TRINITY_DN24679_c0_g1_i1.p1 TRINITY_DN24679_c0_g1~~TRINITY_DN24679_c0_g1_i1.p1  ORF type:complete len:228 (+),score=16.66 TRINITY_DN24679_c0_g1_i1:39-686(+)